MVKSLKFSSCSNFHVLNLEPQILRKVAHVHNRGNKGSMPMWNYSNLPAITVQGNCSFVCC